MQSAHDTSLASACSGWGGKFKNSKYAKAFRSHLWLILFLQSCHNSGSLTSWFCWILTVIDHDRRHYDFQSNKIYVFFGWRCTTSSGLMRAQHMSPAAPLASNNTPCHSKIPPLHKHSGLLWTMHGTHLTSLTSVIGMVPALWTANGTSLMRTVITCNTCLNILIPNKRILKTSQIHSECEGHLIILWIILQVDSVSQTQFSHRLGMLEAHPDKCRLVPFTLQPNLCKRYAWRLNTWRGDVILPGFWTTIGVMKALSEGEPAQKVLASCQLQPGSLTASSALWFFIFTWCRAR